MDQLKTPLRFRRGVSAMESRRARSRPATDDPWYEVGTGRLLPKGTAGGVGLMGVSESDGDSRRCSYGRGYAAGGVCRRSIGSNSDAGESLQRNRRIVQTRPAALS